MNSLILITLLHLFSCTNQSSVATKSYIKNKDYKSLTLLVSKLELGQKKSKVVKLLGPASYSPTPRQDYYHTDDNEQIHPDTQLPTSYGLVIDYNENDQITGKSFELLAE